MNKQREAIYGMRRMTLEGKDTREFVVNLSGEVIDWFLDSYCEARLDPEDWNLEGLRVALKETYGLDPDLERLGQLGRDEMAEHLRARVLERYEEKESTVGAELMRLHERMIMLQIVDTQWKDHLYALDHLKEGIGLRGYGQRDPLVEYKKESFQMFQALRDRIDEEILKWIHLYQPVPAPELEPAGTGLGALGAGRRPPRGEEVPRAGGGGFPGARALPRNVQLNDPSAARNAFAGAEPREAKGGEGVQTVRREGKKVGRNDPCPCGSGKKYKKCHGA
jgi:preprotein translocase subunit SecA